MNRRDLLLKAVHSIGKHKWEKAINQLASDCMDVLKKPSAHIDSILGAVSNRWSLLIDPMVWAVALRSPEVQLGSQAGEPLGVTFFREKRIAINPYIPNPSQLMDTTIAHEVAHAVLFTAGVAPTEFCNATNRLSRITAHHRIMQDTKIDRDAGKIMALPKMNLSELGLKQ